MFNQRGRIVGLLGLVFLIFSRSREPKRERERERERKERERGPSANLSHEEIAWKREREKRKEEDAMCYR